MNLVLVLVSITPVVAALSSEPSSEALRPLRRDPEASTTTAARPPRGGVQQPPMAALPAPPVEATVGKGGRDLTARLRVEGDGWGLPAGTVELYGDLGEKSHLIGHSAQYYRFQPALVAGIRPISHVELFTGFGVGPTEVMHGVCSDSYLTPCNQLHAESVLVASTTAQIGTRIEWSGPPVYAVVRLDAVAQHGWSSCLALAFETNH